MKGVIEVSKHFSFRTRNLILTSENRKCKQRIQFMGEEH